MRSYVVPLLVPIAAIAGGWAVIYGLWKVRYFDLGSGPFDFFYLDLTLMLFTARAGAWVYRSATSRLQRLAGMAGPLAYAGGWALLLHSLGQCQLPCFALTYPPIDYAEGLAPTLGTLIGD